MEQISEILFICIVLPMIPMLFIFPDKRSRLFLGYMMVGALICLLGGALNIYILSISGKSMVYVTTTITPIIEEILKAIPVLYFALIFSDDRDTLLSISFALGVGFAVLENAVLFGQKLANDSVSIEWAFIRVTGAALMHGACTAMIGMGLSYVKKRKKLFFCGTFALLITAIIYHATFNVLIQSQYRVAAFILPAALYLPIVVKAIMRRRKNAAEKKAD